MSDLTTKHVIPTLLCLYLAFTAKVLGAQKNQFVPENMNLKRRPKRVHRREKGDKKNTARIGVSTPTPFMLKDVDHFVFHFSFLFFLYELD